MMVTTDTAAQTAKLRRAIIALRLVDLDELLIYHARLDIDTEPLYKEIRRLENELDAMDLTLDQAGA